MKKLEYKFSKPLFDICFPNHRIKTRKELINILMETCRNILYAEPTTRNLSSDKLVLQIDKMSRLFFCSKKEMYSIAFPFMLYDSPSLCIKDENYVVDSSVISCICSLLGKQEIELENSLAFFNFIDDIERNMGEDFWRLLKHLMTYEIGYIRYDDDQNAYSGGIPFTYSSDIRSLNCC